jgi:hypothetical protein
MHRDLLKGRVGHRATAGARRKTTLVETKLIGIK